MLISDLTVAYEGKPAVSSVSLPVRQGEVLALIGPSGCGKTTLLRSLNRLTELRPTATTAGHRARWRGDPRPRGHRAPAARVDGLPAAEPVSDEHLRQRRLRVARAGAQAARPQRARAGRAGRARAGGPAGRGPRSPGRSGAAALGWPAAASLHRTRARGHARRCCCSTSHARRSTRARRRRSRN